MKFRTILLILVVVAAIGLAFYFSLPKETITVVELPPRTLPAVVIP